MDIDKIEEGKFLEIKLSKVREHKGLWKIVKVEETMGENNDSPCIRMTLDKDETKTGDEIYAEIYPEIDENTLFVMVKIDEFEKAKAESWPPPCQIAIDDVEYFSLNGDTPEDMEEGFDYIYEERTVTHWEYESEDGEAIVQLLLEDGYITMFAGYPVNTNFTELT